MPNPFGYTMYHGFMKSCSRLLDNAAIREIEIELIAPDYLDNFALDMLLLLKERAAGAKKSLSLLSSSIPASRILGNHLEMFNITHTTTNDCIKQEQSPCGAAHEKYTKKLQDSPPSSWHM